MKRYFFISKMEKLFEEKEKQKYTMLAYFLYYILYHSKAFFSMSLLLFFDILGASIVSTTFLIFVDANEKQNATN